MFLAGVAGVVKRARPDVRVIGVQAGACAPFPLRGPCLRCERHDRQLTPRVGQFGCLTQSRCTGVAALEDDRDRPGRTGTETASYRAVHQSCAEPRHTKQR